MGRPRISRLGQKPHRLLAVEELKEGDQWYIVCECDCGKVNHKIKSENFRSTKSCGCARAEFAGTLNLKHGMSTSKEYYAWDSLKDRCRKPQHFAYGDYGGRGINVCGRWLESFESFYSDMGPIPSGGNFSIDRIDVNGDYCPENCRWTDAKTQNNNKRNNVVVELLGQKKTLSEWCDLYDVSIQMVSYRVSKLGMDYKEALETPKMRNRK